MKLELHFFPGLFAEGVPRFLRRLEGGSGAELKAVLDSSLEGDPSVADVLAHLLAVEGVTTRRARFAARLITGGSAEVSLEVAGAHPAGRQLCRLLVETRKEEDLRDLEQVVLGLACAALAKDGQGACLIGATLGAVGVGAGRGTVTEQLRGALAVLEDAVDVLLLGPDTAERFGVPAGWVATPLGELVQLRRE
jgi:hypothetical protein